MTGFIAFSLMLLILYVLSRKTTDALYSLFFSLTKNPRLSIYALCFLILPGTLVHEFAHLLTAVLLRVPAGSLTIIPEVEKGGEVRAGSVLIGRTDPFRQTLIGIAPLIAGTAVIFFAGSRFFESILDLLNFKLTFSNTAVFYLFSNISLTMFSSKRDLKALIFSAPVILLLGISVYLSGIRIDLAREASVLIENILWKTTGYLAIVSLINFLVLASALIIGKTVREIFSKNR